MSLLTIVQGVCDTLGLTRPSIAYSSTDEQVRQIVALINKEGQDLANRYPWQSLRNEATFTTTATESQGDIETIAPGLRYIVNGTIWDRTTRRPIFGEVSPQRWQQLKALQVVGPWVQFVIRGGELLCTPVPAAGDTAAFEYITKYWVTKASDSNGAAAWTADGDTSVLDEQLIELGAIWRWRKAKGLDYAEEFASYERRVTNAMARDGAKDIINPNTHKYEILPTVTAPAGSWNQ